jgi:signal transduction histidine kinase
MVTTDSGRRRGIGGALPALFSALRAAVGRVEARRENPMMSYARGVRALDYVAHELRTPLTVIRGYLSLIEDGTYPVPPATRDGAVSIIAAKAQELDSLIDVLHTASKLANGLLPVQPARFELGGAVDEAVSEVAGRARLEWATIETTLTDGPIHVTADRGHIVRIVVNLLHNALTYSTRPAKVTIEVRRRAYAEVVVRDRGIGIAADRQCEVFERFRRLDSSRPRYTSGVGLGLPISRELAVVNGGSLALDHSEPAHGSTFVLRLPVRD